MKRNTKLIGDISEAKVLTALIEAGYHVLIPFGENHRYDLVIDDDGTFLRVQVKTGRLRNGAIQFNGYSSHTHRGGASTRTYVGEVEYFGVFCPQVGRCYLVPSSEVNTFGSLRFDQPRNGQNKHVRWARRYEVTHPSTEIVGARLADVVPFPGLMPS